MPWHPGLQEWPTSDLRVEWGQAIGRGLEGVDCSFGPGDSQMTMDIIVAWEDFVAVDASGLLPTESPVVQQILGFSTYIVGLGELNRFPPMRHPIFTWLRAVRISAINGVAVDKATPYTVYGAGPHARTKWVVLSVAFSTLPYRVMSDSSILADGVPQEWRRWTKWNVRSRTEILIREQGHYIYVQDNTDFLGIKQQRVPLLQIDLTWFDVPLLAVCPSPENRTFPNIRKCVGKVNSAEWCGYLEGTLLCEDFDTESVNAPVQPIVLGFDNNEDYMPETLNICFHLLYFEPEPLGDDDPTVYGHNLATWPGDRKWYQIVDQEGHRPYDEESFTWLFTPL